MVSSQPSQALPAPSIIEGSALARSDTRARLLMSTPGVGTIVALTYAAAIDDPARFKSSKTVGAHFGLTPTKYQSGETDRDGRISKIGDGSVRAALYESAHIILTKPVKGCTDLKSWAMRVAKRAGMKKAKVALARKLAVIMHRMLANGTTFTTQPASNKGIGLKQGEPQAFGRVITPAFPKRGPNAGTMDQVRPPSGSWHQTTQTVDWPTYPLQTPSGGGRLRRPRTEARPRRKDARKWRKGIDKPSPVTEARMPRGEVSSTERRLATCGVTSSRHVSHESNRVIARRCGRSGRARADAQGRARRPRPLSGCEQP
jgi:hypothetical protein